MDNKHWNEINKIYNKVASDHKASKEQAEAERKANDKARQLAEEEARQKKLKAQEEKNKKKWKLIRESEQVIEQILQDIKLNHPDIRQARTSFLYRLEETKREKDRSHPFLTSGGRDGLDVITDYIDVEICRITYILSWGNKLGLTKEEEKYVEQNRWLSISEGSYDDPTKQDLRMLKAAPEKILLFDKKSIAVLLERKESSGYQDPKKNILEEKLFIKAEGGSSYAFNLKEFVKNSEIVYRPLIVALEEAKTWEHFLEKGIDYVAKQPYVSRENP